MSVFVDVTCPPSESPLGEWLPATDDVVVRTDKRVPRPGEAGYLWVGGAARETVTAACQQSGAVVSTARIEQVSDWTLLRVTLATGEVTLSSLVGAAGGTVLSLRGDSTGWTVRARFPDRDAVTAFYHASGDTPEWTVQRVYTSGGFSDPGTVTSELSDAQHSTLRLALALGYFEVPREVTRDELASELDVSSEATSQRIRRGLKSLLASTTLSPESTGVDR